MDIAMEVVAADMVVTIIQVQAAVVLIGGTKQLFTKNNYSSIKKENEMLFSYKTLLKLIIISLN
jgi:hypothetical protein